MGKSPIRGALRRLFKWIVKEGKEELEKELEERRDPPPPSTRPPFPR